jgi:GNAT superfamily N-acetyltransferase
MLRPTIDIPAMPALSSPLIVRQATVADAAALTALLGRAYPSEHWDTLSTEKELFHDETVKTTLVVSAEMRLVATASLQIRPDFEEFGQLRWVGTEQDRRREGLARALVIGVLAIARQEGCPEVRLHTTTDLSGAIALYLRLGFEPLIASDHDRIIWERVFKDQTQQNY